MMMSLLLSGVAVLGRSIITWTMMVKQVLRCCVTTFLFHQIQFKCNQLYTACSVDHLFCDKLSHRFTTF
jgi:hypothetical protein